jgi:hypothetical protein
MKKLILLLIFIPLVCIGQKDIIEVDYVINTDKSVSFNYKKNHPGSYFLIIKFNSLNNTRANSFKRVVNSASGSLMKLKPINPDESIGFQYSSRYYEGNLNSKIDYDYPYILPFGKGKTSYANELFSLESVYLKKDLPKGWKSYSFNFENPEIIRAIRKGVVVEIINNFKPKIDNIYSYYSEQNFIKIEHSDGSLASYKGLDNNIEVKIGQLVYPQTKLGKLAKYDTKERYKLYLSLYSFKTIKGKTLNNIESSDIEINYITPKFYINGDIKELKNREIFEVDYNEDVLFKEMRRREIKRYKSSNN